MKKYENEDLHFDELFKKLMEIYKNPISFLNVIDAIPGETQKEVSRLLKTIISRKEYNDQIIDHGMVNKLLVKFYKEEPSSNWQLYSSIFDSIGKCPYAVFKPLLNKYIDLNYAKDLFKLIINESDFREKKKKNDKIIRKNKAKKIALELSGTKIWDAPVYTIDKFPESEGGTFNLSLSSYLSYRLDIGEIQDEIFNYVYRKLQKGKSFKKIFDKISNSDLPFRLKYGETLDAFCDLSKRDVPVGVEALIAFQRENDYLFIIQKRAKELSETPGGYAVLPAAIHQHMIDIDKEKHLINTLYREIYEELFGGEEVSGKTRHISHDWYFKSSTSLKELRDQSNVICTGGGMNLNNGFFDFSLLVRVTNSSYWDDHCHKMKTSWEASEIDNPILSTNQPEKIEQILKKESWLANSRFAFEQGLIKLQTLDPSRCSKLTFLK
jgi:hypothetical protein